jgi:NADPH2:quinone reductase
MSASPKVRAARLVQHGQPLRIEPVQLPEPGDDEVLVTLQFGGVNPVDRYVAEGRVAPDGPLPRTLGGEAAGTASGRPVLVAGEGLGAVRDGVWAQAAVVPNGAVVELPAGVEPREAAAMGIAGLTAYNVVHELAQVTADDRVLVLGASGGVGTMIVSLATASGATVWGQIGSPAKAEVVERQGAERALVAGPDELAAALDDFEPTVVFDPLGGDFLGPVIDSLAVHGRLVSFGTSAGPEVTFNMQTLYRKGLSLLGYAGMLLGREQRRRGLEAALAALSEGQLRIVIDEVLALERVTEAFERIERRQVRGKLLLALAE